MVCRNSWLIWDLARQMSLLNNNNFSSNEEEQPVPLMRSTGVVLAWGYNLEWRVVMEDKTGNLHLEPRTNSERLSSMSQGPGLEQVPFPLVTRKFRKNTRQKWPPPHSCLLSCSLPLPKCWKNKTQLYPLGFEICIWWKKSKRLLLFSGRRKMN